MSKKWLFLFTIVFIVDSNTPRTSAQHTNYGGGRALQGLDWNSSRPKTTDNDDERVSVANSTAPSSIIWRVATFPLSIVTSVFDLATGFAGSLVSGLFSQIWYMTKIFIIPNIDKVLMEIASVDAFPENLKGVINQAHTAYGLAKMFGYLKPA